MKELFRRVLGYFGKDKKAAQEQGPTLLGMETQNHWRIPKSEEIKRAVNELKKLYEKSFKSIHHT